jgi:hypothetical protein
MASLTDDTLAANVLQRSMRDNSFNGRCLPCAILPRHAQRLGYQCTRAGIMVLLYGLDFSRLGAAPRLLKPSRSDAPLQLLSDGGVPCPDSGRLAVGQTGDFTHAATNGCEDMKPGPGCHYTQYHLPACDEPVSSEGESALQCCEDEAIGEVISFEPLETEPVCAVLHDLT